MQVAPDEELDELELEEEDELKLHVYAVAVVLVVEQVPKVHWYFLPGLSQQQSSDVVQDPPPIQATPLEEVLLLIPQVRSLVNVEVHLPSSHVKRLFELEQQQSAVVVQLSSKVEQELPEDVLDDDMQ